MLSVSSRENLMMAFSTLSAMLTQYTCSIVSHSADCPHIKVRILVLMRLRWHQNLGPSWSNYSRKNKTSSWGRYIPQSSMEAILWLSSPFLLSLLLLCWRLAAQAFSLATIGFRTSLSTRVTVRGESGKPWLMPSTMD